MPIRPLVDRTYLEQVLLSRFSHGEVQQWVQKYFQPYRELMSYYRCAIMEVETKFNVLNEELSLQYDRNPIETIKTRLKSPESIAEKLQRLRHRDPKAELSAAGAAEPLPLAGRSDLRDHFSALTMFLNSRPRTSKLG